MAQTTMPLRFFEPDDQYFVIERRDLPHWVQAGTICFLTWRTWDSMPRHVVDSWLADRNEWLKQHGIDPRRQDWRNELRGLPASQQHSFHNAFSVRWDAHLDECRGACVLRRPDLAADVAQSLRYFDHERYLLTDFVIMPNHVHLLAAFPSPEMMLKQCESWKHYTAVKINQALGRRGRFWEVDGFDHLVRSEEQFQYFRRYVADNPRRAALRTGEFIHYTRDL